MVEVLSPGSANQRRDREIKLRLYGVQGVQEYWILDWPTRTVQVYRQGGGALRLTATLGEADTLESPLLPGCSCPLQQLFADLSPHPAGAQV